MGHRTWVKLYCSRWLTGTLRQETPALRGIWADVLALAGDGAYGDEGSICLANRIGLTDVQIAAVLNLHDSEWANAKARLIQTDRISANGTNVITVTNFARYQSEYQRQKPYRKSDIPKLQSTVTPDSNKPGLHLYREGDMRYEMEKEKDTNVSIEEGSKGGNITPASETAAPATTSSRKRKETKYKTFEDVKADEALIASLKERYPELDLDYEIDRCEEWWRSSGNTVKSAKLAFQNWLAKAKERATKILPTRPGPANRVPTEYHPPEWYDDPKNMPPPVKFKRPEEY